MIRNAPLRGAVPDPVTAAAKTMHRCLVGFDDERDRKKPRRYQPGDEIAGLSGSVARRLAEQGVIESIPTKDGEDA